MQFFGLSLWQFSVYLCLLLHLSSCSNNSSHDSEDSTNNNPPTSTVSDNTLPTITLVGETELTLEAGDTYIETGATANDGRGGELQVNISGEVDSSQPDRYEVHYTATDSINNTLSITRIVHVRDTTPPTITLYGPAIVITGLGDGYREPGFTAHDAISQNEELLTYVSGSFDTSKPGDYKQTYTAIDRAGNMAVVTRIIRVKDDIGPIIMLTGPNTLTLEAGSHYSEEGAVANDSIDGNRPVTVSGSVNTRVVGSYPIQYSSSDKAGNTSHKTRIVNIRDTQPPMITLNGKDNVVVEAGAKYFEQGAIAIDTIDGDRPVTYSKTVNTDTVGSYIVHYHSSDQSDNTASIRRTVHVIDTTAPIMTLNGAGTLVLELGNEYIEQGAVALDTIDGKRTVSSDGYIDANKIGRYEITYHAKDSSGNSASIIRTIEVKDTTAPNITLNGKSNVAIEIDDNYVEQGAKVEDAGDSKPSIMISGSVNTSAIGDYDIIYTATDQYGNTSTIERTVSVQDTTPPVITLRYPTTRVQLHGTYTESEARAHDRVDGEVPVIISGNVDTTQLGEYIINYRATDSFGNSTSITRTVEVFDGAFITQWDTSASGPYTTSDANQISFRVHEGEVNFSVDWGDGTIDIIDQLDPDSRLVSHTYESQGNYTVKIKGTFPGMNHEGGGSDAGKLKYIKQWGSIEWSTMKHALAHTDIDILAYDVPKLHRTTSMAGMFYHAEVKGFSNLKQWDVSNVSDMSHLFHGTRAIYVSGVDQWDVSNVTNMSHMFHDVWFNSDITQWDVSNVTNMSNMFNSVIGFNHDISSWDVSNVTNMSHMFAYTRSFNQPLDDWNTSNVTNMSHMFHHASVFDQALNNWNVSNVTNMSHMFAYTRIFNQPLDDWNTSNVTNMSHMFHHANVFDQALNNWDVSNVTNLSHMFANTNNFDQLLSNWDVSNVTNMSHIFAFAKAFNQPLNNWDVSNVTNMSHMFAFAKVFNQPLNNWDVSNVTNMSHMFAVATAFNQYMDNWHVSKVNDMSHMFDHAKAFNHALYNWDVSNVTNMSYMFFGAEVFNQPLNSWDVSNVTNMPSMFSRAKAFNQTLNSWDVSNVTKMNRMFSGAKAFDGNISQWDVSEVIDMDNMFASTDAFNSDLSRWDVSNVLFMDRMFDSAKAFDGDISQWDVSNVVSMNSTFYDAESFNGDISQWDVSNVFTMHNMLVGVDLSSDDYDAILIAWSQLDLQREVEFASDSRYYSEEGRIALDTLINNFGWVIHDNSYRCIMYHCI